MSRLWLVGAIIASGLVLGTSVKADEWPGFRGPGSAGLAGGTSVPLEWGADKNVKWKVKIPGVAWSCPIVWGDKVFVTTAITENQRKPQGGGGGGGGGRPGGGGAGRPPGKGGEGGRPPGGGGGMRAAPKPPDVMYRWEVMCLDRNTGKELWKKQALEAKPRIPTHISNTFASETPVTDGERLYVYFGMMGLFCYDLDGKELWKKDLGSYPMMAGWGTSSSPVLEGDRLFLQIDNEEKSFLVALNCKTGQELWRVARAEKTNWGSPIIWKNSKRTELVTSGSQKVRSYQPEDGKVLWEMNMGGGRICATPVADAEMLYVGSEPGRGGGMGGRPGGGPPGGGGEAQKQEGGGGGQRGGGGGGGGLYAIKAGASGDISLKEGATSNEGVAWSVARGGVEMASPLVYQGHLYVLGRNGGVVNCYDAKTGKVVYRERLPGAKSYWASPWASGDKIYCLDDGGTTHVIAAGPEFKVLSKNALEEMFWATPAIAGGAVYLRSVDHLYCVK